MLLICAEAIKHLRMLRRDCKGPRKTFKSRRMKPISRIVMEVLKGSFPGKLPIHCL
jgi:hypothetical protein